MEKTPLDSGKLDISKKILYQPPVTELISVLTDGLTANFEKVIVKLGRCPRDPERQPNQYDLCGDPTILEIGGPAYLLPLAQKDKFYNIETLLRRIDYHGSAFVIGAGAGLWPHTTDGSNCELIIHHHINTQIGSVVNNSRYAFVDKCTGECVVAQHLSHNEQHQATCPILANLYVCKGEPGMVIKVYAKKRTGKLDFIASMQKALGNYYKDELVGLGGMFTMRNGKIKQHVMPDYSNTPLTTEAQLNDWLHFYEMKTPLTAVGTFVSAETELDLRVQHFHSFAHNNKMAGHYHIDTTPDTIEYEGYFNIASVLYRVDQPTNKLQFGKD
ncbi:ester hydrolase C11orf54 homolog [Harpegnathos saltator]|uniref:Ester hydrolase C11orf54-like protein n=1 Tax=Harpegnathos saltator TaxID=610380 RepID=E2C2B0_HARSA|nr:ester hydrolase C11orf54 homolog [Harpegnathos saltator]EFN77930.1 Ester hydrolase C11orf54-like protein [Harpegnathos saltator]